jgi:hypothetical protein
MRRLTILLLAATISGVYGSPIPVHALTIQKEHRPRTVNPSKVAATGGSVLPAGTVIILRMESKLHSGSSQISDRFTARLVEPLRDTSGTELIPASALVEGYVESVTQAQMKRRAGTIGVHFDMLRFSDGRGIPIEGVLTEAGKGKPKVDDENQAVGKSTFKQSAIFIGGGAGAGAVIGAIAGGALLGVGVGAAAGVAAAYFGKGKDAVVEKGTRIGLELTKPVDLELGSSGISRVASPAIKKETGKHEQFSKRPGGLEPEEEVKPAAAPAMVSRATPTTGNAAPNVADLGARIVDKVEVLVVDYATSIGAKRGAQGGYDFDKKRQPSSDAMELLFYLSNLQDSAQMLRSVLTDESNGAGRRLGAERLSTLARDVERKWSMVKPSEDLDRKWRALELEISQLMQATGN